MDFCNYKQYTDGMTTAPDPAYILFGIKHSGKTTQGRLLSKKISFPFVDIDEIITKQTGFTPRQIYFDYGPEKFMSAEEKICSVLEKKDRHRDRRRYMRQRSGAHAFTRFGNVYFS